MTMRALVSAFLLILAGQTWQPVLAASDSIPHIRTGNFWFETCKSDKLPCISYIVGLFDGADTQSKIRDSEFIFCWKGGMSYGQLGDVLVKYLQDHPEERHEDFRMLALKALGPLLRCK
jgi:hypothetical protein